MVETVEISPPIPSIPSAVAPRQSSASSPSITGKFNPPTSPVQATQIIAPQSNGQMDVVIEQFHLDAPPETMVPMVKTVKKSQPGTIENTTGDGMNNRNSKTNQNVDQRVAQQVNQKGIKSAAPITIETTHRTIQGHQPTVGKSKPPKRLPNGDFTRETKRNVSNGNGLIIPGAPPVI